MCVCVWCEGKICSCVCVCVCVCCQYRFSFPSLFLAFNSKCFRRIRDAQPEHRMIHLKNAFKYLSGISVVISSSLASISRGLYVCVYVCVCVCVCVCVWNNIWDNRTHRCKDILMCDKYEKKIFFCVVSCEYSSCLTLPPRLARH